MSWPIDEATNQALRSILIMTELYGNAEAIKFLSQELARLRVIEERRSAQRALIPYEGGETTKPATADLAEIVRALEEALGFYANADNYEGKGNSRVQRDKGERARAALDAVEKVDGEGDDE
jgi:hypothetical protein